MCEQRRHKIMCHSALRTNVKRYTFRWRHIILHRHTHSSTKSSYVRHQVLFSFISFLRPSAQQYPPPPSSNENSWPLFFFLHRRTLSCQIAWHTFPDENTQTTEKKRIIQTIAHWHEAQLSSSSPCDRYIRNDPFSSIPIFNEAIIQ